ncbi:MAG: cystathionine beta-synthase [Chthoniobacteraceae bacterium]
MAKYDNILQAVGRTPLVKLNRIGADLASDIYVKVEYLNPGGSSKDRIGVEMVQAAEEAGILKPGGTIVEATAGNTGVGLALVAAVKGYKLIVVLPDKMSGEKIALLRAYGAEVVITATNVPPDSPESYNGVADRIAREIPGAFRAGQFVNPRNPQAHYQTTGPEIWEDSEGKVEVFVAGMGTGGTISGTARYLKEKNPNITVVGADPEGSILSGDTPRPFKVEGIGEDFIPKTFDRQLVDEMVRISDYESFNTARRLTREEGIFVGGSSGTALAAALKYAQRLERPRNIVVLLPDTGRNYLSKIYSDDWMRQNGFWQTHEQRSVKVGQVIGHKKESPAIISVGPKEKLKVAVQLFTQHNISQLPVIEENQVIGSLNEASIMKSLHDGVDLNNQDIGVVMGNPLPVLDENTDIAEAYRLLLGGSPALVVTRNCVPHGIISRFDIINALINKDEYGI